MEHFEYNRGFWDIIFSKAQRPILREVFQQLEDRGSRYEPLLLELFPPETRPRQREVLIEMYRKGKIAEAFRAFKKIYLEIVDEVIHHLKSQEAGHSVRCVRLGPKAGRFSVTCPHQMPPSHLRASSLFRRRTSVLIA
jgi:hypothetical protein